MKNKDMLTTRAENNITPKNRDYTDFDKTITRFIIHIKFIEIKRLLETRN